MTFDATDFARAVREGRFFDAATDDAVHAAWKDERDPVARALLILAAAHLHASRGNAEGARAKLERAEPYLAEARGDARATELRAHREAALAALEREQELPTFPLAAVDEA